MINKICIIFLSLDICLSLIGCGTLKKKLEAVKTEPEGPAPVPKMHSNLWWYKTHYTYWRYWEEELINSLSSDNPQKQIRCSTEALYNLKKMRERLVEEKQKELEPYIAQLDSITKDIIKKNITPGYLVLLRGNIEKHKRQIDKQFRYSKAWQFIKADTEKLPEQDYE
ncbi:MAG: hypothetical protein FJZ16_06410 [Candidatus Omnitrophica bacterium]|nr:hypothetical protein [Candidatus Omnitrophota bacterium]